MKRFLLCLTATTFALAGMSQSVQPVHRSQVEKLPMLVRQAQIEKKVENKSAMRKTAASKIYYTTPAGTFWILSFNTDDSSLYRTYFCQQVG